MASSPSTALALLVVVSIGAHSAFAGSRITLSLATLQQGLPPLAVGLLISLYAVVPMLLSLACGRLIDRVGAAWPLYFSLLGLAAAVTLPNLWPAQPSLFLAAVAAGVSFMVTHLSVQQAVGMLAAPEERTRYFSWLALGFSLSGFIGPTLAGSIMDWRGYSVALNALAWLPLITLLPLALVRRALPAAQALVGRQRDDSALDLLTDSQLRSTYIAIGVMAMAWDLYTFAMPVYGQSVGLSAALIGLIMGTFSLATFLVRLALPWVSRRADPWRVIFGAMALAGIVYLIFPWVTWVPLLILLSVFLGLGLGSTQPMALTLIHQGAPMGREGEALGMRSTVVNASSALLPLVFGAVSTWIGISPLFMGLALVLALGAAYARGRWSRR